MPSWGSVRLTLRPARVWHHRLMRGPAFEEDLHLKKLVIGLGAVVLCIGAGIGGVEYIQWRATSEVDAVFSALRTAGRQASHGEVTFDFMERNLVVREIKVREQDGSTVSVETLTIAEVSAPKDGRISAKEIKADGIQIEVAATNDRPRSTYHLPSATVEDYSGPDTLLPRERGRYEALNLALRQMALTRAAKISIPRIDVRIAPLRATEATSAIGYRKIEIEGIADGRIASLSFKDMGFTFTAPADNPDLAAKGSLRGFRATDIDTAPVLAATRPSPPAGVKTVYGRVIATGYTLTHGDGTLMEIGEASAEAMGFEPSTGFLQGIESFTTLGEKGGNLTADESRRLMETTADLVKAFAFTEFRMKDVLNVDDTGSYRFGTITASDLKQGRLARLAIENASGPSEGAAPFSLESFTIKGLSPLPILSAAARGAAPEGQSDIDNILSVLRSIEGIEVKGLVSAAPDSSILRLDALALDWGAFIGVVPTRLALRMDGLTLPLAAADQAGLAPFGSLGLDKVTLGTDMALAYDPATRTIALAPGSVSMAQAFSADVGFSLGQVAPAAFEDPIAALAAARQITVGALNLKLVDHGLVDLMLKIRAELDNTTPEAVRAELSDLLTKAGAELAPLYPEAPALADTLSRFVSKPGTLEIRLQPLSDLKLMDAIAEDPATLLGDFRITATTKP